MLIPSMSIEMSIGCPSLSRRVNANSQPIVAVYEMFTKLIKKGEC